MPDMGDDYYIRLCASIGRDLLAAIRDAQGQSAPDSQLIKQLVGNEADSFVAKLREPAEFAKFSKFVEMQFAFLEHASALLEKSEAEVKAGGFELQSLSPTDLAQLAPYALLTVTAFSLLFSFRSGPTGVSFSIPNDELLKRLIDKNSVASIIQAIRGGSSSANDQDKPTP